MSPGLKCVIIAAALFMFWVVTAPYLAEWLIVEKKLEKADVIFVLSGSAVYSERTRKAAEVYRSGASSVLLLSDDGELAGWSAAEERNPSFVELAKRSLAEQGVPSESITILDSNVTGTIDEARGFAKMAAEKGYRSVLIVTSAYHTRRALKAFERELAGAKITVGIVSPPPGERTPPPSYWWITPKGWQYVGGEYIKGVYYWLFY